LRSASWSEPALVKDSGWVSDCRSELPSAS
jgi:hypothetical protein